MTRKTSKNTNPAEKKAKRLTLSKKTLKDLGVADPAKGVKGGLALTRPYTKVSVCAGGGACASELC